MVMILYICIILICLFSQVCMICVSARQTEFAVLTVDETFKIDPKERVKHIYGTDDLTHPGVMTTIKRIGNWALIACLLVYSLITNKN